MGMITQDWLDAQYSVLGCVLLDDRVAPKVMHGCNEADFSGPCLRVYTAMRDLFMAGKGIDPITVSDRIGKEYNNLLLQLMEIVPTTAYLDNHIEILKAKSRLSKLRDIGMQLQDVSDLDTARGLLDQASGAIIQQSKAKAYSMTDLLKRFMDRHTGDTDFIDWPIPRFNGAINVRPGNFVIVAGEPSAGKTAWSLQCANFWGQRYRVGYFSLETDPDTLMDRAMSGMTQISKDVIVNNRLTDDDWAKVAGQSTYCSKSQLKIIPASGWSVEDIKAKAMEEHFDIIIVDYIQMIASPGKDQYSQVTNASMALHTMAQSLGIIVVGLSQINRSTDSGSEMSKLKGSGQLEYDADVVQILKLENDKDDNGPRILRVVKNKEGERRKYRLAFDGKRQLFSYAPPSDQAPADALEDKQAEKKARQAANDQKRQQRTADKAAMAAPVPGQFAMLPADTPVPF